MSTPHEPEPATAEPGDRDRWSEIDAIFARALGEPAANHAAFLDDACGGDAELRAAVDTLLRASGTVGPFLQTPVLQVSEGPWRDVADEIAEGPESGGAVEERVERYRLLREIGRGGMGTVYLAERADGMFEHQVALKLLRRGLDTDDILERFRTERQILASLDHPHIARLLDGGATETGRPYLVMEYVEGQSITQYCDARRLSVEARLELFVRVAEAVQHAHRNLVVHRDLKPLNILVTEDGRPKLLDFGIAKILNEMSDSPRTRTGHRLLTPEYASPEQARGERVTTATDVYQLGLLLYELLTGQPAHRLAGIRPGNDSPAPAPADLIRPSVAVTSGAAVRAGAAARAPDPEAVARARGTEAARLAQRLRGDLDAIVLTALREDPEARYGSAERLADDVRRHLAGLPVSARGDSVGYRLRTFTRRHRSGITVAAAIVLLLIAYGVTVSVQARRITHERDRARIAAARAEQVSDFLVTLFRSSDPRHTSGEPMTVHDLLADGARRVGSGLNAEPEVQAHMLAVLGDVNAGLGQFNTAAPLWSAADSILRQIGAPAPQVAEVLVGLAQARLGQANYPAVDSLLQKALGLYRSAGVHEGKRIAQLYALSAEHQSHIGNRARADSLYRRAIGLYQDAIGLEHPYVATVLLNHGILLQRMHDYEPAERLLRQALRIRRATLGEKHPDVAYSMSRLADHLDAQGRYADADALFRQALARQQEIFGERGHPDLRNTLSGLSLSLQRRGAYDEAEVLARRALELDRHEFGSDHQAVSIGLNNLGMLLSEKGDYDGADEALRESLAIKRRLLGDEHPSVAVSLYNLGALYQKTGELDRAEAMYRRVIELDSARLGADHVEVAIDLNQLATLLRDKREYVRAEAAFRRALPLLEAGLPAGHTRIASAHIGLGSVLTATGRAAEAEPLLRSGLEVQQANLEADSWKISEAKAYLGSCLAALGRRAEAEALLLEAYAGVRNRGKGDPTVRLALGSLVSFYEARGDVTAARRYQALLR